MNNNLNKGFTLVELLIVVMIIGILAAIAVPAYNSSVLKGKRSDGKTALMDATSRLEQFYLDNKSYTADMTQLGYSAAANVDSSDGYYKLKIGGCPIASCYVVTAIAQGSQADDKDCNPMTVNSLGVKTPTACW